MRDIRYYTKKLCSFPHRGTGTEYERKAAQMIFEEFKKVGYDPEMQ